jgi:signal recognition particle subunit SRP19
LKLSGRIIVWPANLDLVKSRTEGRKVAKGLAIPTPRLDEINEAAKRLFLEAELVPAKSRPSAWWEKGGYAIISKKGPKTSVLRSLVSEIKKARTTTGSEDKEHRH